ncbi:MAG: transcriptional repressor LexA [Zavarzinella sp.]
MTNQVTLTKRQAEIYSFILEKIAEFGYPPSIREIGDAFEIVSPNGVVCHLKALEKKGYIERNKGAEGKAAARAISIPGDKKAILSIPMLGFVSAGTGLEVVPQNEKLELGQIFPGKTNYALQVRGQSMIEDYITDGDIVIIRKQDTAENGERVIAMIDGAATLKRFYHRHSQIILEPANSSMQPIIVDPSKDIKILGVLIGVIRKC